MVRSTELISAIPGIAPLVGLADAWVWGESPFMHYAFLAGGEEALYRINTVDGVHGSLVSDVIEFVRGHGSPLPETAVTVIAGFTSSGYSFDSVAISNPAVFRYDTGGNPDLTRISVAIFPAFLCEFSGSESIGDASYRVERALRIARLYREPVPFLKIKYSNPAVKAKTRGAARHFMSYDSLEREIRQLEGVPDAYVEFENYMGGVWRIVWEGSFAVDDLGRDLSVETVLQFAHDAVYAGGQTRA